MNSEFKRMTRTYHDGVPWLPLKYATLRGEGELNGPAVERLAMYEALLQMEPAQAALLLKVRTKE